MGWKLCVGLSLACALGCASAGDPTGGASPTSAGPAQDDATSSSTGTATTGVTPPQDDGDGDDGSGDGGTSGGEASTTAAEPGGSSESGVLDGSSSGDAETFPCDYPTTCVASDALGGVSGDTATPPLMESGTEPIWLQVEVSEQDSNAFGNDMRITITLASEGADWDLRAFLGDPGDTNGCFGQEQRSQTAGVDTTSFTWGETGTLANNTDDGTFIAVEIFPKEDVCTAGSSWSLTVTGNG